MPRPKQPQNMTDRELSKHLAEILGTISDRNATAILVAAYNGLSMEDQNFFDDALQDLAERGGNADGLANLSREFTSEEIAVFLEKAVVEAALRGPECLTKEFYACSPMAAKSAQDTIFDANPGFDLAQLSSAEGGRW